MAQIFHKSTNSISKVSIVGGALFAGLALTLLLTVVNRSSFITQQSVFREQPVPFSHRHHVGGVGVDCRYCHTSVEDSAFAGLPPSRTCMNCHSQIWLTSPMLEPVRQSFYTGKPLEWNRVHNLADFVYFNHSIHINKGVGCATCHGQVDRMPLMLQENSLQMEWCLNCHRNPEKYVRPREEVFNMAYHAEDQEKTGKELVQKYKIQSPALLTSCSTCHH